METRLSDRVRWAYTAATTAVCVTVFEVVMVLTPRARRVDRYCALVRGWARALLVGIPYTVEHRERVPRGGGVLFVSNHQSNVDIPLLHAALPVPFRWMCRDDLFAVPFLGRALRRMEAIEVYRGDRRRTLEAVRHALAALEAGSNVVIFPEGTWGDAEGRMRPWKAGVLALIRKSGATVVPLTIQGSHVVNPPFTSRIEPGRVTVHVHEPVPAASWARLGDDEALAELRSVIGRELPHGAEPAVLRPGMAGDAVL